MAILSGKIKLFTMLGLRLKKLMCLVPVPDNHAGNRRSTNIVGVESRQTSVKTTHKTAQQFLGKWRFVVHC